MTLKTIFTTGIFCIAEFIAMGQSTQTFSLIGTVKSAEGKSISNASVTIKNTLLATTTNLQGSFTFKNITQSDYELLVTCLGFENYSEKILIAESKQVNIVLIKKIYLTDELIISSTRLGEKSAMAYSYVSKEQIEQNNTSKDIPLLLESLPSVVITSDAGAGVGYTGIRIRGSDASRINVTINGIPINDAESQNMYWVDLPDLASSVEDIQVQRGVGTSTNGAGAFGGSINIQTDKLNEQCYAESNVAYGMFNTLKTNIKAGTGLLPNKFAFDARLSKISSDGYIDRASSNLKSFYVSGGYYGTKTLLKFNAFSGKEITYQSWYGTPESRIKNDEQGMLNYIVNNGLDDEDAANLLNSGRTYNYYTYTNQVDDYQQDYYQLHFSQQLSSNLNFNASLHYTKGKGFYEEYKKNQPFVNYNLPPIITATDTIESTNLVRRKWLNNDFYGFTYALNHNNQSNFQTTLAGAWNQYDGDHYNELTWAEYAPGSNINQRYFFNNGLKTEFNIFSKTTIDLTNALNAFVDIQYRHVGYNFTGFDINLNSIPQTVNYDFINPKAGMHIKHNSKLTGYISVSIGNKEPSREDFTDSSPISRPKFENLTDIESGFRYVAKKFSFGFNYYLMLYKNQLVPTGQLNDVGNYTRTNSNNSYRKGYEIETVFKCNSKFTIAANATFSKSIIKKFVQFTDAYDENYLYIGQKETEYKNTYIAFSPSVIASGHLSYAIIKNLQIIVSEKCVSKQYLDNTSDNAKKLDAYATTNFQIRYTIEPRFIKEIGLNFTVFNLLNELYESNGYTWAYYVGEQKTNENFYYPQAGIHFIMHVSFKF